MRIAVVATAICLSIVGLASAADANASIRKTADIPAGGLAPALTTLAKEFDFQVLYKTEIVGKRQTEGVSGAVTAQEALEKVLNGTGLTYKYLDERTVMVMPVGTPEVNKEQTGANADAKEGKKNSSEGFRVAQVDQGRTSQSSTPVGNSSSSTPQGTKGVELEEIVVTAQKRAERLLDTPQSVSVVSANDLAKLAATQFVDWANTVPGLDYTTAGAGYSQITLRGVTMGYDVGPTVGIYVDEVPYGSSTIFALNAQFALDAVPFDLDRIEVLRGPQGTLYGASSMGGLIKYVTKQPNATQFSGDVQTGVSAIGDGGGVNYNVAGDINIPIISGVAAIRASAFQSHDGGFIDNVALHQNDADRSNTSGGRLDFLLTPTDSLSIRLAGYLQDISRVGEQDADYTFGGAKPYGALGQYRLYQEPFDQHFRIVSGTVTYDFDWAEAKSISGYQTVRTDYVADISGVYAPILNSFGFGPFSAVGFTNELGTDKFTQELRLSSKPGSLPLEWVIGGFYTHEDSTNDQAFPSRNLARQDLPITTLYDISRPSVYEEYAGFGDLTWHLSSKFDITGGLRYSENKQNFSQEGVGPLGFSLPVNHSSESVKTYLGDARYHPSSNTTLYVRYATGYRPGGPNVLTIAGGPATFESDHLTSYEAGFKAETIDRRFSLDVATYDIDWKNIQIQKIVDGFGTYVNAPGGATIQGAELALAARPTNSFTATGNFSYQHAYMNQANSDLGAAQGERLPNVPRFTANLDGTYVFSSVSVRPSVGAAVRYVTDRFVSFNDSTSYPQYRLSGYTTADVRGGLTLGPVDAQLYVHNVFDERGQLGILLPQFGARVALVQPRTVGITLSTRF
jgi:iron complex outermembrane recepter protein